MRNLALALLVATTAGVAAQDSSAALAALVRGRYAEALRAAAAEPDPIGRQRLRARIYAEARDFAAALDEARAGLELAPRDLELLWRVGHCALWLQDDQLASATIVRIERVLADTPALAERASWDETLSEWSQRAAALAARRARALDALARARCVALGVLALSLASLWFLALSRSDPRHGAATAGGGAAPAAERPR